MLFSRPSRRASSCWDIASTSVSSPSAMTSDNEACVPAPLCGSRIRLSRIRLQSLTQLVVGEHRTNSCIGQLFRLL